ncbi:MAG: hypothetical protein B9S32_10685 [Verrucomicrobia bacterium Tous-C9LFEB]|nr:MAG: hypothetical protein B9S32_10685 [Verrucomicrobia bacterium Tous-C9LFEB]
MMVSFVQFPVRGGDTVLSEVIDLRQKILYRNVSSGGFSAWKRLNASQIGLKRIFFGDFEVFLMSGLRVSA